MVSMYCRKSNMKMTIQVGRRLRIRIESENTDIYCRCCAFVWRTKRVYLQITQPERLRQDVKCFQTQKWVTTKMNFGIAMWSETPPSGGSGNAQRCYELQAWTTLGIPY